MNFPKNFQNTQSLSTPSDTYFEIIPSDSDNFDYLCRSIRVGGDGDIAVVRPDNSVVEFKNCVAGEILPVIAKRVNSTGTTATDLIGF